MRRLGVMKLNAKLKGMEDTINIRLTAPEDYEFLYDLHSKTMYDYIESTWGWDEACQQNYFKENFNLKSTGLLY